MELVIGEEYGIEYQGIWQVRRLSYGEGRELLARAAKSGDQLGYIEELTVLAVSGPVKLERNRLGTHPMGLVRRLQTATLELNETSEKETAFLWKPSSEGPPR